MTEVSPSIAFLSRGQYKREDLIGKNLSDFYANPESRRNVLAQLQDKGCINDYEITLRNRDGSMVACSITARISREGRTGAAGIIGSMRDITLRKQAQEALSSSRRLLAEAERIGKVGGWELNIDTGKQVWTDEVYRIHEVDSTFEPTIENGIGFYVPSSKPIIAGAMRRAMEQGEPFDVELEIITAKGNHCNVHAVGRADLEHRRVVGFFQDVSEHARLAADKLSWKISCGRRRRWRRWGSWPAVWRTTSTTCCR